MPQFTEFPALPQGEYTQAADAFVRLIRATPVEGEPFASFRKRLKKASMWNRERLIGLLRFLQIPHSDPIVPSAFMRTVIDAADMDAARDLIAERLWTVNPLLFKAVLDRLEERVHSPNELFKYVDSFAYPGARLSHPEVRNWIRMAQGLELLKTVGIRVAVDHRGEGFQERAQDLDIEDFLEEDEPEIWPPVGAGAAAPEGDDEAEPAEAAAPQVIPAAPRAPQPGPAPRAPSPQAPSPQAPSPQTSVGRPRRAEAASTPLPIRLPAALTDPHEDDPLIPGRQLKGVGPLSDEQAAALRDRLAEWWSAQAAAADPYPLDDFHLDAEAWMEDPQRALFHLAVGGAMAFRLGLDPDAVRARFEALDAAEVLDDLYHGTVPEVVPTDVDPQSLMLASLVARRLAERPDLAQDLERKKSAKTVLEALDQALGRGLFSVELLWLLRRLDQLGVVRVPGAAEFRALPTRALREILFRFGALETPYAADLAGLTAASAAARRLSADTTTPPDQILLAFAQAAGCQFSCPHRRRCGFPCRERADLG